MNIDQYITVKEVAELYGLTARSIIKKIHNGYFDDIKEVHSNQGKGGKSYLISLNCLPAAMIDQYYGIQVEPLKKDYRMFTNIQRDNAYRKRNIVQKYERFCQENTNKKKAETFVSLYNKENPNDPITVSQLYRWKHKWELAHDIVDLIDTRGGHNKGKSKIPEEAKNYFLTLYLDQRGKSVQLCYDSTCRRFKAEGIELPSYSAFKRLAQNLPLSVKKTYREGESVMNNQVLPHITRDPSNLEVNEIWQSDHKLMDVFVLDENGKPCRPWLTSWIDIRSRKIVGAYLRIGNPNMDTLLHALHVGIIVTGCIPKMLYTDNGKDYKAKAGLCLDVPDSLANRIGIEKIIRALPYNARAKLIERFHRTIDDRFAKLFDSYTGPDALFKPEDLETGKIPLERYPTFQQFSTAFYNWLEDDYHNRIHRGRGMGDTPNNIYDQYRKETPPLDLDEISYQFKKRIIRKVGPNGIFVNNMEFRNEKLIPYLGQQVTALVGYSDIQHIDIEDINGVYICSATANPQYMYNSDLGQYEKVVREKKASKKELRKYKPKAEIDIHEELMKMNQRTHLQEIAYNKEPAPKAGSSAASNKKPVSPEVLSIPAINAAMDYMTQKA